VLEIVRRDRQVMHGAEGDRMLELEREERVEAFATTRGGWLNGAALWAV
jgi:hypothetical protein